MKIEKGCGDLEQVYAAYVKEGFLHPIIPLTPNLNPPAHRQPAEVFKFGFEFLMLALRKKIISHTLFLQI
jgi:hypothetical protein